MNFTILYSDAFNVCQPGSNPPALINIGLDLAPACYLVKVKSNSCLETLKICKVR
jgi:hypothetical protein